VSNPNWMDASELAGLRADIQDTLPEICNILSVSRTADGYGGMTETWGTASASVACRMDHKVGKIATVGGAAETYQGNMLTLPYDASITTSNRVQYGGNLYNVDSVSEGSSIAVKRVQVQRV
jgi:head-tail adaptor